MSRELSMLYVKSMYKFSLDVQHFDIAAELSKLH